MSLAVAAPRSCFAFLASSAASFKDHESEKGKFGRLFASTLALAIHIARCFAFLLPLSLTMKGAR